jgi:hypothetical protein
MSNKVIRDGKVAVLYSPGFGAGWSTWNSLSTDLMFDPVIVDFVLNKSENWIEGVLAYCSIAYPDAYTGGVEGLKVEWVASGSQFLIEEYDGSETVAINGEMNWITA